MSPNFVLVNTLTISPELDIWCIALTLLSLLLRLRFPLGPHHTHHSIMRSRVLDRLQELDELYPPKTPWIHLPNSNHLTLAAREYETREWKRVRKAMYDFLEIDGKKRMRKFGQYQIGEKVSRRVGDFEMDQGEGEGAVGGMMKSTSFLPTDIKYTLPLYLLPATDQTDLCKKEEEGIILDNPTNMKERKVLSYIRYLLRSAGIGYHCLQHVVDESSTGYIYQLVLSFPNISNPISQIPSRERNTEKENITQSNGVGWVASLNPFKKRPQPQRSSSVPSQPKSRSKSKSQSRSRSRSRSKSRSKTRKTATIKDQSPSPSPHSRGTNAKTDGKRPPGGGKRRYLRTWIRIEFEDVQIQSPQSTYSHPNSIEYGIRPSTSRSSSRTRVDGLSPLIPNGSGGQLPDMTTLSFNTNRRPSPSPRRKTSDRVGGTGIRPSPLSRQVSAESTEVNIPTLSRATSTSTSARTRVGVHTHSYDRDKDKKSRVIIYSSDPRGYAALRRALDVKHHHHSGSDRIVSGNGSGSSDSEISPIVIQQPTVDREEERERGRPRSKESQKSIMMLEAISSSNTNTNTNTNINIASPEDIKSINQVGVTVVDEPGKRKGSRERKTKTGFWSLFASVDSNVVPHRSYSVPPSRELV